MNENSIQSIAWDLFDRAADAADAVQVGYRPMFRAFADPLLTGAPLTSIYPFLTYIRSQPGVAGADVASLALEQGIRVNDAYGTGETNSGDPGGAANYTDITLNATPVTVCGSATAAATTSSATAGSCASRSVQAG